MEIVKLKAVTKDYIWGGTKLYDWGFSDNESKENGVKLAEAWSLSFHKDGASIISGTDKKLCDVATREDWGANCARFEFFPVLIKFINSADNLSVQVHPSDDYALKNEGQFGKTEMWYVLGCDEGAGLYVGFKNDITKDEYAQRIKAGTLTDALNFMPVKKGDCFFIGAGTVHAIGKGCMILEIQQNSNLTYRVYDFGRVGADGKPRDLHIDKAIKVSDLNKYSPKEFSGCLADCEYFTAVESCGNTTVDNADSFTGVTAVEGIGEINGMPIKKGDTYFVPAGKKAEITGNVKTVLTYVK